MIKIAVIGLGKMGLSHASILGGLSNVELVSICDSSYLVVNAFKKYCPMVAVYEDFLKMLSSESLDAVVIATPTKFHYTMAKASLEKGIHVFCEKPFALTLEEGEELVLMAKEKKLNNQVGYHNHFIGTFMEMQRLLKEKAIGTPFHFTGEAYGPVITKPKGGSWRAKPEEGGGCLYDYASHVINLIQEIIGRPVKAKGTLLKKFYSKQVEDGVFSSLIMESGLSGTLTVNWSDETFRKMSTSLMILGDKGKIICDATEIKIYLKEENKKEKLPKGWTIKYITELALPIQYYLRGEEYSAQLEYFISSIKKGELGEINTFEEALYTDKVIEILKMDSNN